MAPREIPSRKPEDTSSSQNDWLRSNQLNPRQEQRPRPQIPERSEPLAPQPKVQARRGNLFINLARDALEKSSTTSRGDILPPIPRGDIPPLTPTEDIPPPTSEQTKRLYQRWAIEDPEPNFFRQHAANRLEKLRKERKERNERQ